MAIFQRKKISLCLIFSFFLSFAFAASDTTAPIISNVRTTNLTSNAAYVWWNTNEPATAQVEYGLTTAYGLKSYLNPRLLAFHSIYICGLKGYTLYHYRVISKDAAGNQAVSGDYTFTTKDTTPPQGTISINNNAPATNSVNVTLGLSATDTGSGVAEMRFSNNNYIWSWSQPEAYATTKAWTLSPAQGTKIVYAKFKDSFGNWSSYYYDTIILDTAPPIGTISINRNAAITNSVLVALTLSASDNRSNISQMSFSNDNSNWSIPEPYKISKLWNLDSADGIKTVYVKFCDGAGNWSTPKSDNITLVTPNITSIRPENDSTFLAGAKISIKANAAPPEKGSLIYRFSLGGVIKQPWSTLNIYNWQTSTLDTGTVEITCEAKYPNGVIAIKSISYHIISPTVEEILQKVADNYALLDDKNMNVTTSSKFNAEKFGETIYTRHYFKKPDKQRTDTFSTEDRAGSSKNEIQITIGPDTHLIDPINHAQSHGNILTELNLTQEQLNQMDELYHLQDFLNAHTIVRLDNTVDLSKGLVTIVAVPKTTTNIYSKLGIQVDYFKGIKTKSLTYMAEEGKDKLKQGIEITDSQKIPNGAWVPKAQVKTIYLKEGNLIMASNFENIQINTNLPDYLFDPEQAN